MYCFIQCNMRIEVRPIVRASGSECRKEERFLWSLRPILLMFRFQGIELSVLKPSLASWALHFFGLLCLFHTLSCHATNCYFIIDLIRKSKSNPGLTVTLMASIIFDHVNNAVHSVGIHLAVIAMTQFSWSKLWRSFQQVGKRMDLSFHNYLRKISSIAALGTLFLVN